VAISSAVGDFSNCLAKSFLTCSSIEVIPWSKWSVDVRVSIGASASAGSGGPAKHLSIAEIIV
jgi:hypothetical protein